MTAFKCKMCGGALEINNNKTVATCEYCGTSQTLPKLDDERRANLYDRANHFRRNNEFDKAAGIYEQILNEDSSDAETYWSLVLCRYGIEYVKDPSSHKRVPTVNRAQYTSIFDDDNYKSALEYADTHQKTIYEAEAKVINEIQKGILAISQKEEPFDVFICYKETDNNSRRTPDSVLANDLYHQLTQEGFKVFFARITLEDKLGSAYEPYIFAALNSAKVMVVLGTKPEHFNAVWVKNEWSRYLALIKNGAKKMLIPAYKDMDPYDLPEEFSHLQAQDMSKLGFMQDLIRGIKKIAQEDMPSATVVKETVIAGGNASVEPLLKRAFMFLEDGDFDKADEFCEQVLNLNPECADAYLGKLMAEMGVCKQEELKDCEGPFDDNNHYQKIVRFADDKVKRTLAGYIDHINIRNENDRLNEIYTRAKDAMTASKTEEAFKEAARLFETIKDYEDSAELMAECYDKAEIARKDAVYVNATDAMAQESIAGYDKAMGLYKVIPDFKDSNQKMEYCQRKIEELKAKEEAERAERRRQIEIAIEEGERRAKRNKKIAIIATTIVCTVIAFVIVLNTVIIPNGKYSDAVALMEAGKYEEAIFAFEALGGYKDSDKQIQKCNTAIMDGKYNDAVTLMEEGKYEEAISAFEALDGYKDSDKQIVNCNTAIMDGKYNDAVALMDSDVVKSYEALIDLDGYKDSTEKANSIYAKYISEEMKRVNVGDYVFFGAYEQDNNTSNGKENLEWLVLAKEGNKVLVISRYALEQRVYHGWNEDVTWATCNLRTWLNDTFINNAFTKTEQSVIATTTVSADKNPEHNTNPGNATQDKVFLLSITEATKYFSSDGKRLCTYINGHYTSWWLRSPGSALNFAAYVCDKGWVAEYGYRVDCESGAGIGDLAVRPALWINLDS